MMRFSVPLKLLIPFVDNPPEYYFFRTTKIWACCPIKDVGRSPRSEGMWRVVNARNRPWLTQMSMFLDMGIFVFLKKLVALK